MNTPESRMDRLSSHFYAEPLLNSVSDICGQYMWDTDHIVSTYGGYTHSPIERIGLAYTPKHRQREYYEGRDLFFRSSDGGHLWNHGNVIESLSFQLIDEGVFANERGLPRSNLPLMGCLIEYGYNVSFIALIAKYRSEYRQILAEKYP